MNYLISILAGAIMPAGMGARHLPQAQDRECVSVRLVNSRLLPSPLLLRARFIAAALFEDFGVTVEWDGRPVCRVFCAAGLV